MAQQQRAKAQAKESTPHRVVVTVEQDTLKNLGQAYEVWGVVDGVRTRAVIAHTAMSDTTPDAWPALYAAKLREAAGGKL